MYEFGRGVVQSLTEAVKWYRLAAEQGNEYGQKNLGDYVRIWSWGGAKVSLKL